MKDWKKVPPELATQFLASLPGQADVERRQMFGCPCVFVNGNMFAGLHEDRLLVRVPDEAQKHPAVIMGKTMKQYAMFPAAPSLSPGAMAQWIARGYAFTRCLPAKVKKAAKSARAAKAPAAKKAAKPSPLVKSMKAQTPRAAAKKSAAVKAPVRKTKAVR